MTIPHAELHQIASNAIHVAGDVNEIPHDPSSYTCECPTCEYDRMQLRRAARARPRTDDDFAGDVSGSKTLTTGKYRR